MTAVDFITELFRKVDDKIPENKHSQAVLYPSEVVTLALLYALKGNGQRAFRRWLIRDYKGLFPSLPDRTRLFRLFRSHQHYTDRFPAEPSMLGVIDSYGIELIHPVREGRSSGRIGRKGISNRRWIVGGKLCYLLNNPGLVVGWTCDAANVYDGSAFQDQVDNLADKTVVFSDTGFEKQDRRPTNLRTCKRGEWNVRMAAETVLSMLTYICDFKRSRHKIRSFFKMKLGFTMALFNILVQRHGFQADENGFVPLSIAEFSL
jgi:hypothetical protein